MKLETTLVLLKPDAVERGLIGAILSRFEQAGLKIIGLKMIRADMETALRHYGDLAKRRGEKVRKLMTEMLVSGPVVAVAIEGIEAIEVVRKMVGDTEPKKALPGTIRGDFTHISYQYADAHEKAVKNVIHASSSSVDAQKELSIWFSGNELVDYQTVHGKHIF